jgi:four helix bundle protein
MISLEDLEVYKVSMEIGEIVWEIVEKWAYYHKDTLGKQFTRAADSIGFNISEGYGRYHYNENKNFCYYSRGSAFETKTATAKAKNRNLLTEEEFKLLHEKLNYYFKLINPYIKSLGVKSKLVNSDFGVILTTQ